MADEMSTPYLLTLIGDRICDLEQMITTLKTQDKENKAWDDKSIDTLKQGLSMMRTKVEERRNEMLLDRGKNISEYAL